jgi:hypothetical protein
MRANLLGLLSFSTLFVSIAACGGSTPAPTTGGNPDISAATPKAPKGPTSPESDKVTWRKDTTGKNCHTGHKGEGDLVAGVKGIADGCVSGTKLKPIGQPLTGEGGGAAAGTPGGMIKQFPLHAQANHCYRVFGLAQASVTDFDIAVVDSAVKNAGEDLTDGNDAIVLEDGDICFKVDDDINVNVAVGQGSGKWAAVIYGD